MEEIGGGGYLLKGQCQEMAAWKMRKNLLVIVGFRYDFTESRAASCMHFFSVKIAALGSGSIFKISKQFQRSKSTLLIISSTREQKIKNHQRTLQMKGRQ
jgi:hypothetical protein